MTGRRLLAAAGAALFGLLLVATPASAAEPTVKWARPTVEDPVITTANGLVLRGTITGDAGDKVEGVSFSLRPTGAAEPEGDPCRAVIDGSPTFTPGAPTPQEPQTVPIEFQVPLKVPCNRTYEVSATITRPAPLGVCPQIGEQCTTTTEPLPFDVAIPPAQVTGLTAAYDPGSKQVGLTWSPNTEKDLLGYRVERSSPGQGFEPVGDRVTGAAFTDMAIDAEHRYRVIAVRVGPNGVPVDGKPSATVTAGPDTPQPTAPQVGPPNQRRPASSGTGNRPSVRKRTATTVDTGFSRDLPFDPSQTTTTQVPTTSTEPEGQAAVLAEFDDDDDPRGTLVPIAGGLALLMSAVHMRLLSQRVGEDDIPILPGA